MDTATCIAAIKCSDKVWMGADSAATSKESMRVITRKDEKIFIREDSTGCKWLIGFTSSYRMGQLIRFTFEFPPFGEDAKKEPLAFMVKSFIPSLQKCLSENGFQLKDKDQIKGGTFLVAVDGNLFAIYDDYQVAVADCGYMAVGCGEQLALGALYATQTQDPQKRLEVALNAAEEFSSGVRGPFHILSI